MTLEIILVLLALILQIRAERHFDFSRFQEKNIIQDDEGQCMKVECIQEMDATSCYKVDKKGQKITMNPILCNRPKQTCEINNKFSGVCMNKDLFKIPELLFPGNDCDDFNQYSVCAYGLQKCQSQCLGVPEGGICSSTNDCNPNFYCN